jgi:hypothetical protein
MIGTLTTILLFSLPAAVGAITVDLLWRYRWSPKELDDKYQAGIREGVEREMLAAQRRLHDSGRRYPARPDNAGPARIHKPMIGNPQQRRPNNPL